MHRRPNQHRVGDIGAMLRAASTAVSPQSECVARKRELVADLCRLLGRRMREVTGHQEPDRTPAPLPPPSPRLKQTLELLLAGASEKQIARQLSLSQHTIHVYVKALYKGFSVSSRGELLARFIGTNTSLLEKQPR